MWQVVHISYQKPQQSSKWAVSGKIAGGSSNYPTPLHPADRIASHTELHTLFSGSIKPWLSHAPLDRTNSSLRAPDEGPETSKICPRLRPRDSQIRQRCSTLFGAILQIVQSLTAAASASPFVVYVAEAMAIVGRKWISLFKTMPFAEWRAKRGNPLH